LENEIMSKLFSALVFFAASFPALAFDGTVPEPGSLALVGIAVAAAVVVLRRKK
jgi:hypothetical protein